MVVDVNFLMTASAQNLIWIDLEMTGLDPATDTILEIATVITNSELTVLAEGPIFAIQQPVAVLEGMGHWCQKHHTESGLVERSLTSGVSLAVAENQTLAFIEKYVPPQTSPMCGNSICQDRRFLAREMPRLAAYFHYRQLDVSSIKELALRWFPQLPKFKKRSKHLALDDIVDSIEELKYYRHHIFGRK